MSPAQAPKLPLPRGPYSVSRSVADGWVFVAGQLPIDPSTGALRPGGIADQAEQVIANIAAVLQGHGATLSDVVKTSVFLADRLDFDAMNTVYRARFSEPYPVRTTVQAGLAKDVLVEIDAIAYVSNLPTTKARS